MPLNRNYQPKTTIKAGLFGLPKGGKTHGAITLAVAACKELELPGDVAMFQTEPWVPDWHARFQKATGKVAIPSEVSTDPKVALQFLKECEADGNVSLLIIDSMSELQSGPRQKWVEENKKSIPLNLYAQIDRPFKALCDALKFTQLHWIATMREDDDKLVVDDNEVVVGKKAKAGDFAYVPRLLVHCTRRNGKSGAVPDHVWKITDCGGISRTVINGKSDEWLEHLQRYKEGK